MKKYIVYAEGIDFNGMEFNELRYTKETYCVCNDEETAKKIVSVIGGSFEKIKCEKSDFIGTQYYLCIKNSNDYVTAYWLSEKDIKKYEMDIDDMLDGSIKYIKVKSKSTKSPATIVKAGAWREAIKKACDAFNIEFVEHYYKIY